MTQTGHHGIDMQRAEEGTREGRGQGGGSSRVAGSHPRFGAADLHHRPGGGGQGREAMQGREPAGNVPQGLNAARRRVLLGFCGGSGSLWGFGGLIFCCVFFSVFHAYSCTRTCAKIHQYHIQIKPTVSGVAQKCSTS